MADFTAQEPAGVEGAHLVLYDGVCGLCNRLVQFLLAHDRRAAFTFASLQSFAGRAIVARFGGNPDELSSFFVVARYRTARAQIFSRSTAALFVASQLGWPWKAAVVLRALPVTIRNWMYGIVASNRYRVFGRYEQCLTPRAEFRARFLE